MRDFVHDLAGALAASAFIVGAALALAALS